jgi:hypothetical protein
MPRPRLPRPPFDLFPSDREITERARELMQTCTAPRRIRWRECRRRAEQELLERAARRAVCGAAWRSSEHG